MIEIVRLDEQQIGGAVLHLPEMFLDREPAVQRHEDRAEAGASEQQFDHLRRVDAEMGDPVAPGNAESAGQCAREPADPVFQRGV